jgi:type II secretory pathway component PulF
MNKRINEIVVRQTELSSEMMKLDRIPLTVENMKEWCRQLVTLHKEGMRLSDELSILMASLSEKEKDEVENSWRFMLNGIKV